jgi:hypothetical protein
MPDSNLNTYTKIMTIIEELDYTYSIKDVSA